MVRIWSKPETQAFIKRLRSAGYEVAKGNFGYRLTINGVALFTAMPGSRGYLCRIDNRLVSPDHH